MKRHSPITRKAKPKRPPIIDALIAQADVIAKYAPKQTKRKPLRRKKPLRRLPKFLGRLHAWGSPFTKFKIVKSKHGPIGNPLSKPKRAAKPKPRKPLRKVSPKRAVLNREYAKAKALWWELNAGRCQVRFTDNTRTTRAHLGPPGISYLCRRLATPQPHHMMKRGRFLCDIATFLAVCPQCHRWIHEHENEARRLGYLLV